ncbi:unnamed protein product [Sphagnum troendelagicum]|uniref:UBX domain-containing protein n=1 Tax=Sphagnum troendelagicum TaxID=128251 RepID=A0ABP0V3A5_9BRYO
MDDMKDKAKDLMKNLWNPFVTTTKFKGQGHKLGSDSAAATSSSSSSSSSPTMMRRPESEQRRRQQQQQQQGDWRKSQQEKWERERGSDPRSMEAHRRAVSEEVPLPSSSSTRAQQPSSSQQNFVVSKAISAPAAATTTAFDPYTSVISSQKSSSLNFTQKNVQCPVCHDWWKSEAEVSAHVEECLSAASTAASLDESSSDGARGDHSNSPPVESTQHQELGEAVSMLLSGGPSNATLDVFVRLLRNILSDAKAEKFRRVRLSNPKIRDTVGMALGGVEFLESVGFNLIADGDEVVAVMDEPSESQIEIIKQAVVLLDPCVSTTPVPSMTLQQLSNPANQLVSRKVDRQMRLFCTSEENQAARIELPDSFFELTASEVKMEAAARKKRLEDSQLLIPKSFRAKQASIAQRRYKAALIRVQFPDGVVLQGLFLPGELTTAIYQFVASVLKNPDTAFELLLPLTSKSRVVPPVSSQFSEIAITLEAANLVPTALLKFQPLQLSSFTGLQQEYMQLCEPLTPIPFPSKR